MLLPRNNSLCTLLSRGWASINMGASKDITIKAKYFFIDSLPGYNARPAKDKSMKWFRRVIYILLHQLHDNIMPDTENKKWSQTICPRPFSLRKYLSI